MPDAHFTQEKEKDMYYDEEEIDLVAILSNN